MIGDIVPNLATSTAALTSCVSGIASPDRGTIVGLLRRSIFAPRKKNRSACDCRCRRRLWHSERL
jgi:hypothetical protein